MAQVLLSQLAKRSLWSMKKSAYRKSPLREYVAKFQNTRMALRQIIGGMIDNTEWQK